MRYRTVFIDLDGTLIDHLPAIHRSYAHTLPELGLPAPTCEQVKRAIGGGLPNAMRKFVPAVRLDEALRIYRAFWDRTMLEGASVMPGGVELLTWLGEVGAKAVVFTNKHGPSARLLCTHLGLDSLLAKVIGADDTAWLKPDPRFADYALAQVSAEAATSCLIGDSPFDVQAALNARWGFYGVTTGTHTGPELSEAGAENVRDGLGAILAEWQAEQGL